LEEVDIETGEFKVRVKRSPEGNAQVVTQTAPVPSPAAPPTATPAPAAETTKKEAAPSEDTSKYVEVKSPMIGTFYRSPNPDSDAFVQVGDKISVGDTVCIIEAMKLFNEIESEVSGTIVKVLAEDSSPVEYDQPLFLVDPS
jgi:acetyl-CoA carboxylase biotin carboxyl carrier protein